jgi:hypothetical protein
VNARLAVSLGFVLASGCTCGGAPMKPIDFDGNVIVGDASSAGELPDRGVIEAGAIDVGTDSGTIDMGGDANLPDGGMDAAFDAGESPDNGCTASSVAVLTATEAIANIGTYENRIVDITGTSTAVGIACTHPTCADGGACCGACTATVAIDRILSLAPSVCFSDPGCAGNECTQVCRPPVIGAPQTFRGQLVKRDGGVALELFLVTP